MIQRMVRRAFGPAALALTAVLSSCAQPAPPQAAAAQPIPAVSLSKGLIEQASAYRAYVDRASQISPAFANGAEVAEALKTGEAYEPRQLLTGAIAYGAVVALQDPGFRTGTRTFAADPEQRRMVAYEVIRNPAHVLTLPGASDAAALVTATLGEDGRKLLSQGQAVRQAAYEVQHHAWSKGEVAARQARLALAKQLSVTPLAGDADLTSRLEQALMGQQPLSLGPAGGAANASPLVVRSLAVAALAALGYGDQEALEQVTALAVDPTTAQCLNLSKLNLYQCLAVAKPHYEDVFCLGQHALTDTGACLMKGAGLAQPGPQMAVSAPQTPSSAGAGSTSAGRGARR